MLCQSAPGWSHQCALIYRRNVYFTELNIWYCQSNQYIWFFDMWKREYNKWAQGLADTFTHIYDYITRIYVHITRKECSDTVANYGCNKAVVDNTTIKNINYHTFRLPMGSLL